MSFAPSLCVYRSKGSLRKFPRKTNLSGAHSYNARELRAVLETYIYKWLNRISRRCALPQNGGAHNIQQERYFHIWPWSWCTYTLHLPYKQNINLGIGKRFVGNFLGSVGKAWSRKSINLMGMRAEEDNASPERAIAINITRGKGVEEGGETS